MSGREIEIPQSYSPTSASDRERYHPDYSETGHLQAVDAAFNNWEAMQKAGQRR